MMKIINQLPTKENMHEMIRNHLKVNKKPKQRQSTYKTFFKKWYVLGNKLDHNKITKKKFLSELGKLRKALLNYRKTCKHKWKAYPSGQMCSLCGDWVDYD